MHYGTYLGSIRTLLAEAEKPTELGRLINYLPELPLTHWSYFFNNAGKLLASYKLLVEHKIALSDAMYDLDLLDAYLSFATLMKEATDYDEEHQYVFC